MLLNVFFRDYPSVVSSRWEKHVGTFEEKQWEEALLAVQQCSLNVAQPLSQLYLLLRLAIRVRPMTG